MSYKVEVTSYFIRQAKRLLKKYPSLKSELSDLISSLEIQPLQGISLGSKSYKIKLSIESKGKGKSGGARVITHIQVTQNKVYLISIFDKSEQPDISEKELADLIRLLPS